MKKYCFIMLKGDGSLYEFYKEFPSAYIADRWATNKYSLWTKGTINFGIIFYAGKEI